MGVYLSSHIFKKVEVFYMPPIPNLTTVKIHRVLLHGASNTDSAAAPFRSQVQLMS